MTGLLLFFLVVATAVSHGCIVLWSIVLCVAVAAALGWAHFVVGTVETEAYECDFHVSSLDGL